MFYNDAGNTSISDLIVMGKATSNLKAFNTMDESVDLRIEVAR